MSKAAREGALGFAASAAFPIAAMAALCLIAFALKLKLARRIHGARSSIPTLAATGLGMTLAPLCACAASANGPLLGAAFLAFAALAGASYALMVLLWGEAWDACMERNGIGDLPTVVMATFALTTVLAALLPHLAGGANAVALCLFPLVSVGIYGSLMRNQGEASPAPTPVNDTYVRFPVSHAPYTGIMAALGSFILAFGTWRNGASATAAILLACMATACAIYTLITSMRKEPLPFPQVERIVPPFVMTSTLTAPFVDNDLAAFAMIAVGLLGASFYAISHWVLLAKWSWKFKLQPAYHYAFGMIAVSAGALVGLLGGIAVAAFPESATRLVPLVCMAAMLGFCITSALSPYDAEPILGDYDSGSAQAAPQSRGRWETTLDSIAEKHALTPRETQIFFLLARGRNTRYVSENLVVSEHTAKTHIGHIYKKLGVGGAQELIDLVEHELGNTKMLEKLTPSQ